MHPSFTLYLWCVVSRFNLSVISNGSSAFTYGAVQRRKGYLAMYEGQSFGQRYSRYYEQRRRRRRRMRRVTFVAVLIVGMAVLALILSERVLPIEVWATPGKEKEKEKEERR